MEKDLLIKIEQTMPTMSKGHRCMAKFILENYEKAAYMTALKLGETIGISESTVVRFATVVGFSGYPNFQKALKEITNTRLTPMQRLNIAQNQLSEAQTYDNILKSDISNIKDTLDNINPEVFEKSVKTILNARKIYVVGTRSCATLSGFLTHYLNYLLPDKISVIPNFTDVMEYIIRIGKEDCLIGISFPRYSMSTFDAMEFAKEQGATTIAITDNNNSPLTSNATYALFAKSSTASLADSLVAPLSLINALIASISLNRQEQAQEYFETLEDVFKKRQIYTKKNTEN